MKGFWKYFYTLLPFFHSLLPSKIIFTNLSFGNFLQDILLLEVSIVSFGIFYFPFFAH